MSVQTYANSKIYAEEHILTIEQLFVNLILCEEQRLQEQTKQL